MSGEGVLPSCPDAARERERELAREEQAAEERRAWEEAEMARHYSKHPHG